MTTFRHPARVVTAAVLAGVCLAVGVVPIAAQPAGDRYEAARTQEAAARSRIAEAPDSGPASRRQEAIAAAQRVIDRYETLVRRFPTSGYSDNALYQAADLANTLYAAYGRASHREMVGRYVNWLLREYPSSPLRTEARGRLRAIDATRQAKLARAEPPAPRSQSPAPAKAAPPSPPDAARGEGPRTEPARAETAPAAKPIPPPSGLPVLQAIERTVLPDVVRLTLPLDREVTFTHETLANPPRAFIDLRGVTASPSVLETAFAADDALRQVRVGKRPDATRVVLDLATPAKVSVFALYNPFRVVIDTARGPLAVVQVPVAMEGPVVLTDETAGAAATPSMPAAMPPTRAATAAAAPTIVPMPPPATVVPVPSRRTTSAPVPARASAAADDPDDEPDDEPEDEPKSAAAPVPSTNTDGTFSLARQLGLGISRIVIDPGHGGHDPGTIANGAQEAEIVLDIALRLEKLLAKEPGLDVVLTRRTDTFVPLEQRTAIANREGADLFLSIHANSSRNTAARGLETYFLSFASSPDAEAVAARENATSERAMHNLPGIVRAIALNNKLDESRDLAAMVQETMTARLSRVNSGIRSRGVKKAPFVVLIGAGMPSVLAEVAFLTNKPEAGLVKTPAYRQRIAESLHAAVMRYRKSLKRQSAVATAR
jgi:N-acetylmuramoyl-L-alanine amidase